MLRTISIISRLCRTTTPAVYSRVLSPALIANARFKYQNRDKKGNRKATSYDDGDDAGDMSADDKPEYNLLDDK
jgi:hypothetical protein